MTLHTTVFFYRNLAPLSFIELFLVLLSQIYLDFCLGKISKYNTMCKWKSKALRESNDFALIHLVIGVNSVSLSTNQMQNKDQ